MRSILFFLVPVFIFLTACGPVTINKPEKSAELKDSVSPVKAAAIVQSAPDSSLLAYGNLYFGMKKPEVAQKNENRQQLGKYEYNFGYDFNGDSVLYRVKIFSDGVKVIGYDTTLKILYRNLVQIVETRYGKPGKHNGFPSVFDVQNSGKYTTDNWELGNKQIDISLRENALNSYSVICEITHKQMADAEKTRLKNVKNKDVIEASKKF